MKLFKFQKDTSALISTLIKKRQSFTYTIPTGLGRMVILWHCMSKFRKHNFCVSVSPAIKQQWINWNEMHPRKNIRMCSLKDANWVVDVTSWQISFVWLGTM